MKKNSLILKEDINFLEFPTWVLGNRSNLKTFSIIKENSEYTISTADNVDRLPDRTDKMMLFYLMGILMKDGFKKRCVEISRYRIAKDILGSFKYDRIMLGLKRWNGISINFKGTFYNGGKHSTRYFHVVDSVVLENKKLKVSINQEFIEQIKNSDYYKLINFDEYKRLKRPVSARLYEIMVKTFKQRKEWTISIFKLSEKLTLDEKYPSHIVQKVIPGINEINTKTELKIKFDYNQETGLCTFTKFSNAELITISQTAEQKQIDYIIPEPIIVSCNTPVKEKNIILETSKIKPAASSQKEEKHQEEKYYYKDILKDFDHPAVRKIITNAEKEHDQKYVEINIRYCVDFAIRKIAEGKMKGTFPGLLSKAIEVNYGASYTPKEKKKTESSLDKFLAFEEKAIAWFKDFSKKEKENIISEQLKNKWRREPDQHEMQIYSSDQDLINKAYNKFLKDEKGKQ